MVLKIPFFCSSGTIIIISQNSNCIIDFPSADSIKLAKVSVTIGGGGGSITKLQIPKRRQRIKGFQSPIKKANFRVTLLYICPYILDLMVSYWHVEWSVQEEAAAANSLSFMIEVFTYLHCSLGLKSGQPALQQLSDIIMSSISVFVAGSFEIKK